MDFDSIRDRCDAVKTLLDRVHGQQVFNDFAQAQQRTLLAEIRVARLTPTEAANLLPRIQDIRWPAGLLVPLQRAINIAAAVGKPVRRSPNQDYTSVVNYYTTAEWANAATDTPKMTTTNVLMRPIELGCRNGTEKTMQVLAAILMTVNEGSVAKAMDRSSTIKHETLKYVKKKLKASVGNTVTVFLPSLPEDPQAMRAQQPQMYNMLYPNDPPVMSPFPEATFSSLVASIPMRCSNVQVRNVMYPSTNQQLAIPSHSQGTTSEGMMQAMFQMMSKMMNPGLGNIEILPPGNKRARRAHTADEIDSEFTSDELANRSARPTIQNGDGRNKEDATTEIGKAHLEQQQQQQLAKAGGPKKKLSVIQATKAILKGINGNADTDDDDEDGESDDGAKKKKKTGKTASSKKAAAKKKVAAVPKKAAAPKKAAEKKKVAKATFTPQVADEASRSQVRCRAADGSSFSFSYGKHGGKKGAMAKARAWLADQ
jgi:hypothetical protein